MANLCSITVAFHSENKAQLERFKNWFKEEFEKDETALSEKLAIGDIIIENGRSDDVFSILGWSKWCFHNDEMDAFLNESPEYTEDIEYCYSALETGCQVFVNTDESRKYIDDEFYVDGCYLDKNGDENYLESETYPVGSEEHIIENLACWMELDEDVAEGLKTLEDVLKYFKENFEDKDDTGSTFLAIERFS